MSHNIESRSYKRVLPPTAVHLRSLPSLTQESWSSSSIDAINSFFAFSIVHLKVGMPLKVLPSRTTQVSCASRSLSTRKCSCRRVAAAAVGRASPRTVFRPKGCEYTRSPQRSGPVVQATERFTEVGATIDQGLIVRAALELEEKGCAVVPDVVSSGECEQYVNSAWAWLENLDTGIKRNDLTTWGDDRWPPSFRGIINTLEISHQDFVWRVRQHPRILQVIVSRKYLMSASARICNQ